MMNLAAVIPACGLTSRMGRDAPLLPLGPGTVLSSCVDLYWANDVRQILVVTEPGNPELENEARELGAELVQNADCPKEVFASLVLGIRSFREGVAGFFLQPASVPLVRPKTIGRLIHAFEKSGASVLYPRFQGKRGFPVLVHGKFAAKISEHEGTGDLRAVLSALDAEASDLDVADHGVLQSLENAADFAFAQQRAGRAYPSPEECAQLWKLFSTSRETIEHCRAVARLGVLLCDRLNERRSDMERLDRELVLGAALTHDIGKGMKRHDAIGGEWLAIHGFEDAAGIVRRHSDLALLPGDPLTEREIVFLADKLVRGEVPVSLDARYEEKLALYGEDPDARRSILGRQRRGREVLRRFEEELGLNLEDLAREFLS